MSEARTEEQRVDHYGLLPCPWCGGKVFFHGHEGDDECHGCHQIECSKCKVMVDLGTTADPTNADFTLTQLRRHIAPFWNRRSTT